jgi:hypothetical protein
MVLQAACQSTVAAALLTCNSLDSKRVLLFFARTNALLRKLTATYLKLLDVRTYTQVAGV